MKICIICSYFPPLVGGSETHTFSTVKHLSEKGFDVDVIVDWQNIKSLYFQNYDKGVIQKILAPSYTISEIENVKIHNIHAHPFSFRTWLNINKKIKEIEKGGKIDIFDIHHMEYALPLFSQKGKILLSLNFYELTCPFMYFPQKYMPDHFTLKPSNACFSLRKCVFHQNCVSYVSYMRWRMIRLYGTRKIDKFLVKTPYLKELMVKNRISQEKIVLIPYWIDVDSLKKESENKIRSLIPSVRDSDVIFSFVGRLDDAKNPLLLLKAFHLLIKQTPHVKLIYIGDGKLRNELEKASIKYKMNDKVVFLGRIPHEDLPTYFSIPDVFVHTQRYSNYGWALLETMGTGKPIIATNVGETSDILIDGYNALLASSTPESLCNKMLKIIEDPKLANNIGKNALETVKEKHSMKNLEKYEALLKTML